MAARWSLIAATLAACGGLEPVEPYSPITDPSALFMTLTLDHGAVNLSTVAPYDQLQLTATPRDGLGRPMAGLPAATFRSVDTTRVFVTPDGLLQARRAGTRIVVIAEIVADGNIRQADTTRVTVTTSATPRLIDALFVEPTAGRDSVLPMVHLSSIYGQLVFLLSGGRSFQPGFTVRALDTAGAAISGLSLEYESLDPEIATVNPVFGTVNLLQPGDVRVVARTTAYGVSVADTATFTVTLPIITGFVVQPGTNGGPPVVSGKSVIVRPGGYVTWANLLTTDSVRVTFDEPASAIAIPEWCTARAGVHCDGGDIPNWMSPTTSDYPGRVRGRRFMNPGTYTFRLEPLGVDGKITVTETLQ